MCCQAVTAGSSTLTMLKLSNLMRGVHGSQVRIWGISGFSTLSQLLLACGQYVK